MTPAKRHMDRVAQVGCVICRALGHGPTPAEIHHIAEGSGQRSDFMVAPLCPEHHRGATGLHGMGTKRFLALYRLPTEYHLLGIVNRYLAEDGA